MEYSRRLEHMGLHCHMRRDASGGGHHGLSRLLWSGAGPTPGGESATSLWRMIMLKGWIVKAVTVSTLILRATTFAQTGICAGLIAALLLERRGVPLVKVAEYSRLRSMTKLIANSVVLAALPLAYPSFGEIPSEVDIAPTESKFSDTSNVAQVLLPFAETNRTNLRWYTGKGYVVSNRVSCLVPTNNNTGTPTTTPYMNGTINCNANTTAASVDVKPCEKTGNRSTRRIGWPDPVKNEHKRANNGPLSSRAGKRHEQDIPRQPGCRRLPSIWLSVRNLMGATLPPASLTERDIFAVESISNAIQDLRSTAGEPPQLRHVDVDGLFQQLLGAHVLRLQRVEESRAAAAPCHRPGYPEIDGSACVDDAVLFHHVDLDCVLYPSAVSDAPG
ncbi:uncharacterized protein BCR38DRAFT_491135 [Pseudomassariella vexata]|uniref:Uncharacterized protein n=1 Tax=Pseudomassariella vexata TaxID=1141098 RepID=A0A1Y2D8C3_9PEZI|nr:uncharacterized protein BCR38DRAFT_491135 [Pseudomassariella vexata]ORY55510.1 hypothetical protein BCR38DRAFT_491135 [Pseudomassariella vexata]